MGVGVVGTEPRIDAPVARWRTYGVAGPPDAACIRAAVVDVIRGNKGASQLMNTTSVRDTAGFGTKRRRAADTGSAAVAPPSPMPDLRSRAQRRVRGWLLLLGLGLILLGMREAAALDRYEGLAYAVADGGLAYREIHWRYHDRGRPARLVIYQCPGGQPFARKRVWATGNATAPNFEFVDGRDGYREGVRGVGAQRQVYWQAQHDGAVEQRVLDFDADAVVDAGFDALVHEHWAALRAGDAVDAAFLLPSRQDFLAVSIERIAGDDERTRLRMSLDAWYGFAAPQAELVYRNRDRWLLQFEGIGSIRDASGDHQRVRIEFPPERLTHGVGRADLETASTLPLVDRCDG